MKILVTGAAGLIGSHLVDLLLEDGHSVVGVDDMSFGSRANLLDAQNNSNFTLIKTKVQSIHLLTQKFDVIYHLASIKKPTYGEIKLSKVIDENYEMLKLMVNESLKFKSHLIFTSTSDVYGNSNTFLETDEITIGPPTNPRYSYALSKLHGEQYVLNEVKQSNLKATIVRIFGCASHRANKGWSGGHVPMFVHNALTSQSINIHGDGLQTRSISHAIDIANGLKSMLNSLKSVNGEIINIGTDQQTTVKEIAEYIVKKTNSSSQINYQPKEEVFGDYNEIKIRFANIEKAKLLINYQSNYSTFEVVDEIIEKFNDENSCYYSS